MPRLPVSAQQSKTGAQPTTALRDLIARCLREDGEVHFTATMSRDTDITDIEHIGVPMTKRAAISPCESLSSASICHRQNMGAGDRVPREHNEETRAPYLTSRPRSRRAGQTWLGNQPLDALAPDLRTELVGVQPARLNSLRQQSAYHRRFAARADFHQRGR